MLSASLLDRSENKSQIFQPRFRKRQICEPKCEVKRASYPPPIVWIRWISSLWGSLLITRVMPSFSPTQRFPKSLTWWNFRQSKADLFVDEQYEEEGWDGGFGTAEDEERERRGIGERWWWWWWTRSRRHQDVCRSSSQIDGWSEQPVSTLICSHHSPPSLCRVSFLLPLSMYLPFRRSCVNSSANSVRFTSWTSLGINPQAWAGVAKNCGKKYFLLDDCSEGAALWHTLTDGMPWKLRTDFTMQRHYLGWVLLPVKLPHAIRRMLWHILYIVMTLLCLPPCWLDLLFSKILRYESNAMPWKWHDTLWHNVTWHIMIWLESVLLPLQGHVPSIVRRRF